MAKFGASVVLLLLATATAAFALEASDFPADKHECVPSSIIATPGYGLPKAPPPPVPFAECDYMQVVLALEYLEAEFFHYSAFGYSIDQLDSTLGNGGPTPVGGRKANLSPEIREIAAFLAFQEVDHVRIFKEFLGDRAYPRPLIDLGGAFEDLARDATGNKAAKFSPYDSDEDWLLGLYAVPYVGLTFLLGVLPHIESVPARTLLTGAVAMESGQDTLARTLLWLTANKTVNKFDIPVHEFTGYIAAHRQKLSGAYRVTERNIIVAEKDGPYKSSKLQLIPGNSFSQSFGRSVAETLSILYGSGKAGTPGGFFPNGLQGRIGDYFKEHSGVYEAAQAAMASAQETLEGLNPFSVKKDL
jgi:hypothetical protein